jgi:hypothetical protein
MPTSLLGEFGLSSEHRDCRRAPTHKRGLVRGPRKNPIAMSIFASLLIHVEGSEMVP